MQSAATSGESSKNVILISNWDTQGLYPKNRPSFFETKLVETWDLPGEWEAAIAQISFPTTWHNFHADRTVEFFFLELSTKVEQRGQFIIPKGYYKSPNEVGQYIADQVNYGLRKGRALLSSVEFKYDARTRRSLLVTKNVVLTLKEMMNKDNMLEILGFELEQSRSKAKVDEEITVLKKRFPDSLEDIERFENAGLTQQIFATSKTWVFWPDIPFASEPAKEFGAFNEMFIYTDFIKETNIGSTRAPVIGMLPIADATHSQQKVVSFQQLIWIPVAKSRIDTIRLMLADEEGAEITLHSGLVIAHIMLRRKMY